MPETENYEGKSKDEIETWGAVCRNDRVLKKCSNIHDLSGLLVRMGKQLVDICGDGNCLFHAVMAVVRKNWRN